MVDDGNDQDVFFSWLPVNCSKVTISIKQCINYPKIPYDFLGHREFPENKVPGLAWKK